jgi:hypothetical protein
MKNKYQEMDAMSAFCSELWLEEPPQKPIKIVVNVFYINMDHVWFGVKAFVASSIKNLNGRVTILLTK